MIPAIRTQQLRKTYTVRTLGRRRHVIALEGLDLEVQPGQVYGLLGPNGAGKSTTIKLLLNLIRPTAGTAELFGLSPASHEARRLVGFLPENPAPYEYLTGAEFVTFAGQLAGLRGSELKQRVTAVLERVQMTTASALQIRRYSKGMTQRISLAQALVTQPKLLILDEPTSGLDVLGRQMIRDIIIELRAQGTTVLLCSHIIPDVEALCERVAVIIGGKLVREGKVSELLAADSTISVLTVEADERVRVALRERQLPFEEAGAKLVLRGADAQVREALRVALDQQARILSLEPTRYSLEQLFVAAVKDSGVRVGSSLE